MPLTVTVAELRSALSSILDHVEATSGQQLVLDQGYFWSVPGDDLFDVTKEPSELTIGQLSESLEFLRTAERDPDDILGYHLVWAADLLRAIGIRYAA
jgi:hypothetical protein